MTTGVEKTNEQEVVRTSGGLVATKPRFRADIQGLRAVAVVLVVVNHAYGWPAGGFVGVDVFYVISGYLITGLLLRELEETVSISLRAFYARRIRRILPAAVVVLLVTVAIAFLYWFTPRAIQTAVDAISALFFVANWHFVALGADYLQADGPVSAVQHYWSLAIEEQFYAVWPLLLLALFHLVRRSRRLVLVVVLITAAVSVVWAALETVRNPAAAYFDTFGRVWELLAGAALAVAGARGPSRRGLVAAVGLAMIFLNAVVVQADWAVPFPGVAPAVVGAVAIIWAAAETGPRSILGNPVSQWLGEVSFSLYLWHFPVLIFATAQFGHNWIVATACIPVMLILSELSRRFVERPFLRGRMLGRAAHARNDRPFVPRDLVVGMLALTTITALSIGQMEGPESVRSASALSSHLKVPVAHAVDAASSAEERAEQVEAALSARSWPLQVAGQLDLLFQAQLPTALLKEAPGCRNDVFQTEPTRVCGDVENPDVMVVGDSNALAWVPGVEAAAGARSVSAVGFANCSLIDTDVTNGARAAGFREACAERRDEMLELIAEREPDVVVLSASESVIELTELPAKEAAEAWRAGVASTLASLSAVPRVVLLSSVPWTLHPVECATRFGTPADCVGSITEEWRAKTAAERDGSAPFANTTFVDTSEWFCREGRCPIFVGNEVIKIDPSHLTTAGSEAVGPLIADYLPTTRTETEAAAGGTS